MKKRLILFFLFLGLPLSGCYPQYEQAVSEKSPAQEKTVQQNQPQNKDPYAWDFGEVKQGEIAEHIFTLKNEFNKTIEIQQVNTSCGCTASQAKTNKLLPGESTEIEVKFDSKGYSGPLMQHVYVTIDNLDNPVIKYTIKVKVVK